MNVLNWLVRPIVLSFIGILVLALLVWIEVPLVDLVGSEPLATSNSRWIVSIILLLLWVAYWIGRWLMVRLMNGRFNGYLPEFK